MTDQTVPRRVKVDGDLFHPVIPAGAVYVGRQAPYLKRSPYANPFTVKDHGLAESRRLFRAYLAANLDLVDRARQQLAGRDLACRCPLDAEWCHADDLLRIAAGADQ